MWLFIVVVVVLTIAVFFLLRSGNLPLQVKIWLKKINKQTVIQFIKDANLFLENASGETKRTWVFNKIKEFVKSEFQFDIPDRYVNMIIEFVYTEYKQADQKLKITDKIKMILNDLYLILKLI